MQANGPFDGGHVHPAQTPESVFQAKLADCGNLVSHGLLLVVVQSDIGLREVEASDVAAERYDLKAVN